MFLLSHLQVSTTATPYQNQDVLPLPPERRTWSKRVFAFFWLSTAINIAEWSAASTALAVGLTVGQALAVCATSTVIITLSLVVSGQAGGKWHIPFAVVNRTAWGLRGSWFVVLNRILLSCCWYGVEGWYGGQMVKIMIGAIWPSFYNIPNHLPAGIGMKTNELVSFVIFWLVSLPIFLLRPESYRIPAIISSITVTVAALSIFIWALAKQGNVGPLWRNPDIETGKSRLSGSSLSWAIMYMITRGMGGWAGGILYQSDFSRYAKQPGDQMWGQIFIIPICLFGSNLLGIITTSCARGLYPDEPLLWKLYDLLETIQKHGGGGTRAAVFFAAAAFLLSQLCVNVVACGVVGGMDLAALLPRYITIRRGSFIIVIIGFAINPWRILNTANSFITVISGYAVFLGPLTGIMFVLQNIISSGVAISDYLTFSFPIQEVTIGRFWYGLNWKAVIAWLLGVFPSMPGFCASVTPAIIHVRLQWTHVYYMSWFLGLLISGSAWVMLNSIWPPPGLREVDEKDVFGTFAHSSIISEDNEARMSEDDVKEAGKAY